MRDKEIDEILKNTETAADDPKPEVVQRISDSIVPSLRPVRPLPPGWIMTSVLVLAGAAVSLAGALRVGLFGFEKMDLMQRVAIFPALGILLWVTASGLTAEMVPASRRRISPGWLLLMACAALSGLFGLLFHDYSIESFIPIGLACLLTGILHAIPAALLGWLVVRRGFAVNPVSAGLAAGVLGGLAGVGMLELHCPNFEIAHLLVWHMAVLPLSSALGALAGWIASRLARAIA